jgi:mono/diheme cytochrome c family protein
MRKYFILAVLGSSILLFSNCHSGKKLAAAPPAKVTYESNLQTVIMANCSPCHIPAKGGNKKAYDNYANVKADIDDMLRRIQLEPGSRGFMPFKHDKLSDSTIAVFRQFKEDGLLEK